MAVGIAAEELGSFELQGENHVAGVVLSDLTGLEVVAEGDGAGLFEGIAADAFGEAGDEETLAVAVDGESADVGE